ncbi:MAG: helix-turn-helix domain-containing protein [Lachnospiraceae bacterium]|nr:helix-turn-helix domain-containing protein [Lachnospiraceae bacterium]
MHLIKELRLLTGLSQTAFAEKYEIPVSTLRKWEQGEASPAPYVVKLIERTIPSADQTLKKITDRAGRQYYYNPHKHSVCDCLGNEIIVKADITEVKEQNLGLYLHDLFEDFYEIRERFERDCRLDKSEDIIWS